MKKLHNKLLISLTSLIIIKSLIIIFTINNEEAIPDFIYTVIILCIIIVFAKKYIKSKDLIKLKIIPEKNIVFIKKLYPKKSREIISNEKEMYHLDLYKKVRKNNKKLVRKIKNIFLIPDFIEYKQKLLNRQKSNLILKNHIKQKRLYKCNF